MKNFDGYTQKQINFLIAMVESGGNISEASKKSAISEATAHRWLNKGIGKDIQKIKSDLVGRYLNKLQLASGEAIDSLLFILKDKTNSANTKLRAIKIVLDMTVRINENDEILKKLEELEERLTLYEN